MRLANLPGSLILPRKVADRGTANWPKCARCNNAVHAYGVENENDREIEIWARCDGIELDPQSGQTVGFALRVHEPMKSSTTIQKGPGWSFQRYTDAVRRLAFFPVDGGDRQLVQNITADGLAKRWGAG